MRSDSSEGRPAWARYAILTTLIGLLLAAAAPALAGKPSTPPTTRLVTMALESYRDPEAPDPYYDGLATNCPTAGPIVMHVTKNGVLEGRSQSLETYITDRMWWNREIDAGYGLEGTGLTGCHGTLEPGSEDGLWITPHSGEVTILWRFDRMTDDAGNVEFLELISNPSKRGTPGRVSWSDTDGDGVREVHGAFGFRRYFNGEPLPWFPPVWEPGQTPEWGCCLLSVEFELTITAGS